LAALGPLLVGAGALIAGFVHPDIARNVFLYLALYAFVLPLSFMDPFTTA
jgi:hypothetical protein